MRKHGFHSMHLCKYIVTYLYSIDWIQNQIPKSCSTHKRNKLDFIGCYNSNKVKNAYYIMTHSIASFGATRKKCDDFWLPGVKSFPTIYNMNDFAVIIFSRYYTLKGIEHYEFMIDSWYYIQISFIYVKV